MPHLFFKNIQALNVGKRNSFCVAQGQTAFGLVDDSLLAQAGRRPAIEFTRGHVGAVRELPCPVPRDMGLRRLFIRG